MSRKVLRTSLATTTAVALFVLAWILWPSSVNTELSKRHIPEIPSYESFIGLESGGFFAHWLFVAVRATDQQIDQYKLRLIADAAVHTELGDAPDQVSIVEVNRYQMPMTIDKQPRIYFKQTLNGRYLDWWNFDKARQGDFFEKILPKECSYQVILDRQHGIIYIYWHYS